MSKYFQVNFIFFIISFICFGLSFFHLGDPLDISLHDTYFVVDFSHIFVLFGTYFLICALSYFFLHTFKRKKIGFLYGIHLWTSIISFVIFMILLMNEEIQGAPKRYYDYSVYAEFDKKSTGPFGEINDYLSLFFILFLIVQVIFLVNIGIGVFSKKKS